MGMAPWCDHCKRLKPEWDKLIEKYKESKTTLVGVIDCTEEGKKVCSQQHVRGYPSLKFGHPWDLQEYTGELTFDALDAFASSTLPLAASCGLMNAHLCDDKQKALLEKYKQMSKGERRIELFEMEEEMENAEIAYNKEVEELNKEIAEAEEAKKQQLSAIQKDLIFLRLVQRHALSQP